MYQDVSQLQSLIFFILKYQLVCTIVMLLFHSLCSNCSCFIPYVVIVVVSFHVF